MTGENEVRSLKAVEDTGWVYSPNENEERAGRKWYVRRTVFDRATPIPDVMAEISRLSREEALEDFSYDLMIGEHYRVAMTTMLKLF